MEGEVIEEGVAEGELRPAAALEADGGVVCARKERVKEERGRGLEGERDGERGRGRREGGEGGRKGGGGRERGMGREGI